MRSARGVVGVLEGTKSKQKTSMCDYCFLHETHKICLQDKITYARNAQISCQLCWKS